MKTIKLLFASPIPFEYTGIIKRSNGDIEYYEEGILHREDGPAKIYTRTTPRWGKKRWVLHGKDVTKECVEIYYMLKYNKLLTLEE